MAPTTQQKLQRLSNVELSKEVECLVAEQRDDVAKHVLREASRRLGRSP